MKHTLFILALITASIQTFAQSPRIKLNQITKDSLAGSVLISSPTDSGMVYSRDLFISYGADTFLILGGDTLAATSGIISSVLSDGVTITGDGTTGNELTADTSVLATLRALSDSLALVISSVTADGVTITGDGTVGSPLTVDTTTYIATKQDLDLYYLDSNPDGYTSNTGTVTSVGATAGTGISVSGSPITTSGTLTITNTAPDQTVSIAGGGINAVSGTYPSFTVTGTEVDGSVTNEGSLTVGAGTASTSVISSNTSGSTDITLTAGTNVTLSETGNNITIAATGGGTTYNNISETADTVYISDYLDVDNGTLYVNADSNRVGINNSNPTAPFVVGNNFDFSLGAEMVVNSEKSIVATYVSRDATLGHFYFGNDNSAATFFGFGHVNSNGSLTSRFTFDNFDNVNNRSDFNIQTRGTGFNALTVTDAGELFVPYLDAAAGDYPVEYNTITKELTYDVSSSIRFKDNIRPFTKGLNELLQLNPVSYEYKETGFTAHGFIAEQVLDSNLEEIVTFNNEGLVQGLRRKFFFPLIVQSIQEQQAIIESQATEIEQLKSQIQLILSEIEQIKNN